MGSPILNQKTPSILVVAVMAALVGALVTGVILSFESVPPHAESFEKVVGGDESLFERRVDNNDSIHLEKSIAVLTRDIRELEKNVATLQSQSESLEGGTHAQQNIVKSPEKEIKESVVENERGELSEQPIENPIVELDKILAESSHDPAAGAMFATLQGALDSLVGTSFNVMSATCSESVCRVDFQHQRDSDAAEARRDLILKLNWDATYIMTTESVPGVSNMLESILYIDKREGKS